ncbi:hypothetical protein [Agrococcus sp. Marseille-P2731]|uniref:hypothetical protein n=1 Tax=Agrococcus sp. Marseille-P2731 TaxID=1841862 RepID=UPI000930E38A|nr:hypothetical protein [Agrococcus sp. Marseille-P2731]
MADASGAPGGAAHEEWEELEPHREWSGADRWRLAAWGFVFANILALLMLAPVGDAAVVEAADAAGTDAEPARLTYWVAVMACTLVGNAVGAAAAATKRRWAIVAPLLAAVGCWAGFGVALAMV